MAFKRKQRKVIGFDFEYQEGNENKTLHYEAEYSMKLSKDLNDAFEKANRTPEDDLEGLKETLIQAYDAVLGEGAMAEIQKYVYDGDKLLLTDFLDIGFYMMEQINKANQLISNEYGSIRANQILDAEIIDVPQKQGEKIYTAEDIAKILNDKNNGLPS